MDDRALGSSFRKMSPHQRRAALLPLGSQEEYAPYLAPSTKTDELANTMTECAAGVLAVPVGIVQNLCVDGTLFQVPVATEEPSVCAAASFGAKIVGPMQTECGPSLQDAQIALQGAGAHAETALQSRMGELCDVLSESLRGMRERGGGLRSVEWYRTEPDILVVLIRADVRDAMGANAVNTAAERAAPLAARITGGRVLACIVSNFTDIRLARARFEIPAARLPGASEEEKIRTARAMQTMCRWAENDPRRAVTHNKGIMNGVSGFALATGNDTRALEAAFHAHAHAGGRMRPLSTLEYDEENFMLRGFLEIPALFASAGGATAHPTARWARAVLSRQNPQNPKKSLDARMLNRIAAALGLAQNVAALRALVSEGIQAGHMKLHAKRSFGAADFLGASQHDMQQKHKDTP